MTTNTDDLRIFYANRSHGNRQALCESRLKLKKYSNRKKTLNINWLRETSLHLLGKIILNCFISCSIKETCLIIVTYQMMNLMIRGAYFRELYNDEHVDTPE